MSSREPAHWTSGQAEKHLRSLELFGMRFGLDRMRRMMTVLGSPERRFGSIHVLGTNGKSSTTRMIAAILERHGVRTGAYLSPHLESYTERVQVGERDLGSQELANALARAAWAAERVNRTLAGDDHVTQFELLTAAAYWALARRGVEVAVIEAGLGGRYDATSVIDARVSVLTNVGLEHTRWLGPTVGDIAAEKLAALSEGATLVLGADPQATVLELARKLAGERSARLLVAGAGGAGGAGGAEIDGEAGSAPPLQARGDFQRRNFELATLAARCCLKEMGHPFSAEAVRAAAAATVVPGRLDVLEREPLVVLDGAHNPHALDALMRSLAPMLGSRALGAVFGVLDDKDAARMLAGLLGRCERVWFTVPPSSRALSPATLESLARQHGFAGAFAGCEPQPARAFEAAVSWASQRPRERAVLGTGSIYLVGELMRAGRALRAGAPAATAGGDGR